MAEKSKHRVLFVCLGNACRSPMAEAIARREAGEVIEASSGGLFPLGNIPEMTLQTLSRNGYSTEGLRSKGIVRGALGQIDLIVNMSGQPGESALPEIKSVEDWLVADPYGEDAAIYQRILEDIRGRVRDLAKRIEKKQGVSR